MKKALLRLFLVLAILTVVSRPPFALRLQAASDNECDCDYSGGSHFVALYLQDWTVVEVRNLGFLAPQGFVPFNYTYPNDGSVYCSLYICELRGDQEGQSMCNQYGLGGGQGMYQAIYHYYFWDFDVSAGGSRNAYVQGPFYNCP